MVHRLGRIIKKSPKRILFDLLSALAVPSQSIPHRSILNFKQERACRPIILLGFARSGTSTIQKQLSTSLGYNASFEPIAFNHSNFSARAFNSCSTLFRGAPPLRDLPLYCPFDTPIACTHLLASSELRTWLLNQLRAYFAHLIDFYGSNVVIKELRLSCNLVSLQLIFREFGLDPLFVFVKANPFMILYSYYRMGGLSEASDYNHLRVNEQYLYKVKTFQKMELFEDLVEFSCQNKYEKLLICIALEYRYLQSFQAQQTSKCVSIELSNLEQDLATIADRVQAPILDGELIKIKSNNRLQMDRYFLTALTDAVRPELLSLLELTNPSKHTGKQRTSTRAQFFTSLRNKLI